MDAIGPVAGGEDPDLQGAADPTSPRHPIQKQRQLGISLSSLSSVLGVDKKGIFTLKLAGGSANFVEE